MRNSETQCSQKQNKYVKKKERETNGEEIRKRKKRDKIIKTIPKTQVVQGARIIGQSL